MRALFDRLIEEHGRRLFGLCLHLCACRQDAEDLYQETWLKAYRAFGRFDEGEPFEAWLTAICVNTFRDKLRRMARRPLFDGFMSSDEKERAISEVRAPEEEDHSELIAAVRALPERYRTAVVLHYFEDKNIEKTAAMLHVPTGTVKSRLKRARELLKEVLRDENRL